jgi:hypothetical protein
MNKQNENFVLVKPNQQANKSIQNTFKSNFRAYLNKVKDFIELDILVFCTLEIPYVYERERLSGLVFSSKLDRKLTIIL